MKKETEYKTKLLKMPKELFYDIKQKAEYRGLSVQGYILHCIHNSAIYEAQQVGKEPWKKAEDLI